MKYLYLILPFLLCGAHTQAQTDPRLKGIDAKLEAILDATLAPSFTVAVIDKDKIIYAKGFGHRDYEKKIPADANTLYAIGSCTKAFTSSILGQLRNESKLSFDDSPIKYVPELRFYNNELNSHVNIKDIMCHRTGIPRHDLSWYLFPTFNRDSLMLRIEHQEPFTGLREQWYYNNFMYLTQGVIAEHLTDKSWEENIKERFFEPLGMSRSNASIAELELSSNAALGYEVKKDSTIKKMDYYEIAAMAPAGSINSSVNDMSQWVITWINGGKYGDTEILPGNYVTEAISPQMIVRNTTPDPKFPDMHLGTYGYGWMMSSYKSHYRVEHGGNIDGFSASTSFFPTDSIGIVVLTNQNSSSVPYLVRNTISDHILGLTQTDWIADYQDGISKSKEAEALNEDAQGIVGTKPSHILQDYTGQYHHPGYGTYEIHLENDSLFAQFTLFKAYLKHQHYDVFKCYEVEDGAVGDSEDWPLVNFITNDAGDISIAKVSLEPTLDPIEFKRTPVTIEVDKATLEKYVGEYDLMGTSIKVYTKNDDTLYLFVAGQPEYELLATSEHHFSFKILEGFKVEFLPDADGTINEMTLIQPNGTFKTTKK
jgi:CubicO group peptidase (beta-lactamase class C family)